MAVVTTDFLAAVLTNFRAMFESELNGAVGWQAWPMFTTSVDSNGQFNTYNWFGTVPQMRDVTHGQAAREGLFSYNFSIENLEWQAIIEVERAALERDQLGLIRPRIGQLAQEAARHPGQLIWQLFLTPGNAYDGVAFFSDTRVIGRSANIDNNLTGTLSLATPTVAQFQADLNAMRQAMRLFQDDQGRPMNLVGNVIVIPAQLEQIAYQALNASQANPLNQPTIPATNQNGSWVGQGYQVIVNPYLTDGNDFYLLYANGIEKPFIYQTEVNPRLDASTNPNEQAVIETRKFLYSGYYRGNVGVTDPRFAVRSQSAVA